MWSLGVYTRKKQARGRLNLTPTPGLGARAKAEAPSRPGRKLFAHCLKRNGKTRGLQRIAEKSERSGQGGGSSRPPSTELRVTGEQNLHENSTSEETQDEKIALLSESVTDDLQADSSSSNSKQVTGLSLQHDISGSLLSYSFTDSSTEYKSSEENLSSFPSPELFRGSDYLEWEHPMLEENMPCKNSTLLDISKAVAIEKVPEFSNLSAILGTSSEDYQKCHRKVMTMLADQSISPEPKAESDNASCRVLLAEKNYPSTPGEKKEKPEKDPEPRDTNFQTTLSSRHLKIKVPSSHQRSVVESSAGKSVAEVLLPQPLKPALNTQSSTSDKKSRGLLTSTPSSQTPGLVIDLSSVQKASFEELFPNVSNYVNSDEIVPVSTLQDNSSNEVDEIQPNSDTTQRQQQISQVPSNASEICYIIKASPGTRQVESKGIIVKKKYSLPEDIPQDIIIKTSGRM
ncbi:meiosis-specific kinetochore protein isoform X2 [Bubalus kerabau]|uniref:meiosis-specific kinetochore protein isoform X2 n=1 Tax=Bubalus carabanensis TaxID=3119969 RepID=UPI00244E91E0|nr:meiosis-specific kinetochore protein isoform X2 [Bubalus carabanensis]